jgi:hypothetical protein
VEPVVAAAEEAEAAVSAAVDPRFESTGTFSIPA